MNEQSGISISMIVRNEEENIGRCLKSAALIAKEIIVADTGSTDRTAAIAEGLGAKVFKFDWTNDFSKARNFSIKMATGRWIFWLDADEELALTDSAAFFAALGNSKYDLNMLNCTHFYGSSPADGARSHRMASHRLFKNGLGIEFLGAIHERLNIGGLGLSVSGAPLPGIELLHYGYMDEAVKSKGKAERNLSLLTPLLTGTNNGWVAYHMAGEYYRLGQLKPAYDMVNRSIKSFLENGRLPPALCYRLKYELLLNSGDHTGAINGIERAVLLYPDYVALHYYKGLFLLQSAEYEAAKQCFRNCLELGEANPSYLIEAGMGSFFALFYLGLCHEAEGKEATAKECYREAVFKWPHFKEAAGRLLALEKKAEKI